MLIGCGSRRGRLGGCMGAGGSGEEVKYAGEGRMRNFSFWTMLMDRLAICSRLHWSSVKFLVRMRSVIGTDVSWMFTNSGTEAKTCIFDNTSWEMRVLFFGVGFTR